MRRTASSARGRRCSARVRRRLRARWRPPTRSGGGGFHADRAAGGGPRRGAGSRHGRALRPGHAGAPRDGRADRRDRGPPAGAASRWPLRWPAEPSHAYLFHGPAGVGKRAVARAFAAELLAEGEADPDGVRRRVRVGLASRPDLGPSYGRARDAHRGRGRSGGGGRLSHAVRGGTAACSCSSAWTTMNDEVANRLLKTLEEPARFVHLILLTDALGQVIPTVVSRCQLVRFDRLPAERIAAELEQAGVPAGRAAACARLASRQPRARPLAGLRGGRGAVRRCGPDAVRGPRRRHARRIAEPWRALLERAEERRAEAEERVARSARRPTRGRAEGSRARRARARLRGGGPARRPPRAHRGARPGPDAGGARLPRPRLHRRGRRARRTRPRSSGRARASAPVRATRAGCARPPSAARTFGCRWR